MTATKMSEEKTPAWPGQTKEAQQSLKERRERKPIFYCRWIATHPYLMFFVTLMIQIFPVIVTVILLGAKYDLFPTNFEQLPMELYDIPYRLRDYAYRDKHKYDNKVNRVLTDSGYPTYERGLSDAYSSLELYFDAEGGNIITQSNLQLIKSIEDQLVATPGYSSSHCQTDNVALTCKKPRSIIRYFDGTYASVNAIFNDPSYSNIPAVIYEAYTNNDTKVDFEYFLPNSYTITPTSVFISLTRTEIPMGCSITGSTKCNSDEWNGDVRTWLGDNMKPILADLMEDTDQFDIYFMSTNLMFYDVIKQAMKDVMLAIGSMIFIFMFMTFHTRSLFISGFAVLSILTSFAATNIIYRCIIGFKYIGFFHVLAIFIILGIGADDLFVFYDSWRLTGFSEYPSLGHRMTDAYSKATKSMLITSLTTAVAFLCSAISPLLATKAFGAFAAILICYNYMSVVIFFPNVVMIYHLKFEDWTWPCCRFQCRKKSADGLNRANSLSRVSPTNMVPVETKDSYDPIKGDIVLPPTRLDPIKAKELSLYDTQREAPKPNDLKERHLTAEEKLKSPYVPRKSKKPKFLVVFFRDRYFRFITSKWTRIVLLPIFIVTVCVFGYFASTLEPDNENLQLLKDSHYYSKAQKAQDYKMLQRTDNSLVKVHVIWGLKNKDRSDCHFSSIECRGSNVYDASFDPNPVANQQALLDFCNRIQNFSSAEISEYRVRTDPVTGQPEIACFATNLNSFLQSKSASVGAGDLSLPWDYTKTMAFMNALPAHYDTSSFTAAFTDYLAIPIGYWLYNEFNKNYTSDFGYFDTLIGEYTDTTGFTKQLVSDASIYYGTKLKYIAVEINTTINRRTTGYAEGIPIVEAWENFINTQTNNMPSGLKDGFQLTRQTWHWFYVQKSLADNAIMGIIIGVCLAFPILTLTTMNVIIGFFATLSICCTTVCVIGVIPLAGWKLGLLVSLNMTMLVGLSVDYVVHLAEGYHLSHHKDRLNRTRDMLEEMGASVFSGACTTLGASLFMLGALVQFFMQFGIFLFCTIGFSLFFSMGLFTLLMGMIGPQNNTGCIKTLYRKIRDKCRKKDARKDDVSGDCDNPIHASDSKASISTVGSQHPLIESQGRPPYVTTIKVNGKSNPV